MKKIGSLLPIFVLAFVVGTCLRVVWPDDIHFLGDESWTFTRVRQGAWDPLRMPSSRGLKNAGTMKTQRLMRDPVGKDTAELRAVEADGVLVRVLGKIWARISILRRHHPHASVGCPDYTFERDELR